MRVHRRVPILFQLEHFDCGIFLCAYAGGKNFICLKHHLNSDAFTDHCKDFIDYYFGWCELPLDWQEIEAKDQEECRKTQRLIAGSIVNVKRKQAAELEEQWRN